jgi:hypothetical protein
MINSFLKVPLAVMVQGQWQPGIGDPSIIGWLTVVAYFLTATLCGLCWVWPRFIARQRYRSPGEFWLFLAVVLIILGINKQLDLQSWFTEFGRQVAIENGWYRQRREVQFQFIMALGLMAIAVFIGLGRLWYVNRQRRPSSRLALGLAVLGLGFLVCFILVRAASFHHVDHLLRWQLGGLTMNGFLELLGIGLIATGAILRLLNSQKLTGQQKYSR